MATILSINKENEKIVIPVEDGDDVVLSVITSDKNIETVLHKVGNAISKFQTLSKNIELATGDEDVEQAKDALVNLMKRTISAIVGKKGWEDILSFIGDGTPVDPKENIMTLGEVFAALVTWLYDHCSNKQLRAAGVYLQNQTKNLPKAKPARPRKKRK